MPARVSRLTGLPTEILEQIFLHLPGQDIVKMDGVRRGMVDSAQLLLTCPRHDLDQPTIPGPGS